MGRYNFAAQRVHAQATQLLQTKRLASPPPWYNVMATYPPSQLLVRPPMQRPQKPGKKASKLFKPLHLNYEEDRLRWEYFNDHPWELARPRVILEEDGKDRERWDWSVPLDHALNRPRNYAVDDEGQRLDTKWESTYQEQCGRPLNGESVVLRQSYLMSTGVSESAAYDKARKELYRIRHSNEIEQRVAREEALSTGAYFGPGPLEIGMLIEDQQYENWRKWAETQIIASKLLQESAYGAGESEETASLSSADQEMVNTIESTDNDSKRAP